MPRNLTVMVSAPSVTSKTLTAPRSSRDPTTTNPPNRKRLPSGEFGSSINRLGGRQVVGQAAVEVDDDQGHDSRRHRCQGRPDEFPVWHRQSRF